MHITVETGEKGAWVTAANAFGGPSHLFVEPNSRARFPARGPVSIREVDGVEQVVRTPLVFPAGGATTQHPVPSGPHAGNGEDGPNSQAQMPPSTV